MSTGAASSRGPMARAKLFMKASYLGKAWNRAPSQGPLPKRGHGPSLPSTLPPCGQVPQPSLRAPLAHAELSPRDCAALLPSRSACPRPLQGSQREPGRWEPWAAAGTRGQCWPRRVISRRKRLSPSDVVSAINPELLRVSSSPPVGRVLLRDSETSPPASPHAAVPSRSPDLPGPLTTAGPVGCLPSPARSTESTPTPTPPRAAGQACDGCLRHGSLIFILGPELSMFGSSTLTNIPMAFQSWSRKEESCVEVPLRSLDTVKVSSFPCSGLCCDKAQSQSQIQAVSWAWGPTSCSCGRGTRGPAVVLRAQGLNLLPNPL